MSELDKTLLTSSVIATVLSGVISWSVTSDKIKQEFHSKQAEAGYEALVKANTKWWQSKLLMEEAKREKDYALEVEARKLEREARESSNAAQQRIAAFGDERVVKAMGNYYRIANPDVAVLCSNVEQSRLDTHVYKAIRDTLGVGGTVSDQELANLILECSLK